MKRVVRASCRDRACLLTTSLPTRHANPFLQPLLASSRRRSISSSSPPSLASGSKSATPWTLPQGRETGVRLWNTLTASETPLIGATSATNTLSWYTCGPTVYDVSHLGHARTYVTVDIILRTLREYFGVHAWHVLNITDSNEAGVPPSELSQRFEREFFRDMTALGVELPATVLRVSEHIDEVVQFIRKLESEGVAYATPSGVYFDTQRFSASHSFKMAPAFEDGLEESGDEVGSRDKRNVRDFALWKAAKQGEPSWTSPWGQGRPGWHIECSAMCSSLFGSHLDVHAGGIDLKFPHHCNEWGNYFVHVGHLHIAGLKMSKSLKNFVSIQDYLKKYTGRQFRIFCLLHGYGKPVDYSDEHMQHAVLPVEKRVDDFLALLHARMRHGADNARGDVSSLKWGDAEKALQHDVLTCELSLERPLDLRRVQVDLIPHSPVRESLASNIDTEDALTSVLDLASPAPRTELLASLSRAVSRPLRVFGVLPQQGNEGGAGESKEAELLDTLARFRQQARPFPWPPAPHSTTALRRGRGDHDEPDAVRKTAISSANVKKDVLSLCDQLRDKDLPPVGFRLEDDPKAGSLWKRIQ